MAARTLHPTTTRQGLRIWQADILGDGVYKMAQYPDGWTLTRRETCGRRFQPVDAALDVPTFLRIHWLTLAEN